MAVIKQPLLILYSSQTGNAQASRCMIAQLSCTRLLCLATQDLPPPQH